MSKNLRKPGVSPASEQKPEHSDQGRAGWFRRLFHIVGPGVVTGASDDDPSGIGTYSQVGAQFGFNMLWTMPLTFPLMAAIQVICARIGRVTGKGIGANLREHYPRRLLYLMVSLLLIANILNIGADLSAMGAALQLLLPGNVAIYTTLFGVVSLLAELWIPYHRYVSVLKWLCLSLFAYVAVVFVVKIPWNTVILKTFMPTISIKSDYLTGIVAVFGTTISPYLFFWQASQEVEDMKASPTEQPLRAAPGQAARQWARIKADTLLGMALSNIVAYFIILTTAVTLHAHGRTTISSATQAAEVLRPIAGQLAFALFALGIIGTGLLAIPVLAGSSAYGVSEALRLKTGLERKPLDAVGFYAVITASTVAGAVLTFLHVNPIQALFWSAVINGVVAVPLMVVIMLMASHAVIMGKFTLSHPLKLVGWLATGVMGLTVIGMLLS
ncbi:NRAMP family divalent metal transporter [Paludibacterium yongneupense]|uniref:NRAMP family divalent metal transporter n=1 Tax=Paludibacterium yongneupense TaxID=400061 RepID=UPI000A0241BE|nr:divalent metal cation transporter [Paludibacterium yongneupense]